MLIASSYRRRAGSGAGSGTGWTSFDPSLHSDHYTYSNGNARVTTVGNAWVMARGLVPQSGGKRVFMIQEINEATADGFLAGVATVDADHGQYIGYDAHGWSAQFNRVAGLMKVHASNFEALDGQTTAAGGVAMVAVDIDAGRIWFGLNGAWYAGGDPAAGTGAHYEITPGLTLYPAMTEGYDGNVRHAYFDPASMPYPIPAGFTGWPAE